MAKKSNVNPDHYKTAGRERPSQGIVQEVNKKEYTQAKARHSKGKLKPYLPPVAASVGVGGQARGVKMRQQMSKERAKRSTAQKRA